MPEIRQFKIYTYGAEILRKTCIKVEMDDETLQIMEELKTVCRVLGAAGMAANQLGHDSAICCILRNDGSYLIMVNPKKLGNTMDCVREREACFSIPGFTVAVTRSIAGVDFEFMGEDGLQKKESFIKNEARYAQHEDDHLNGIMICDKQAIFGRNKLKHIYRESKRRDFHYIVNELGEVIQGK